MSSPVIVYGAGFTDFVEPKASYPSTTISLTDPMCSSKLDLLLNGIRVLSNVIKNVEMDDEKQKCIKNVVLLLADLCANK